MSTITTKDGTQIYYIDLGWHSLQFSLQSARHLNTETGHRPGGVLRFEHGS